MVLITGLRKNMVLKEDKRQYFMTTGISAGSSEDSREEKKAGTNGGRRRVTKCHVSAMIHDR